MRRLQVAARGDCTSAVVEAILGTLLANGCRTMGLAVSDPAPSILAAATPDLRHAVDTVARDVPVAAGEVVCRQGETGDAFFIIDDGEIEISVLSADGRKLVLDVMTRGEIFGEIALFGGTRTATATASCAGTLRRVRRADVMRVVRAQPDLALELIDLLCARLRAVSAKLEERAFSPVPMRLAGRLLYLADKVGDRDGGIAVTQSELADLVGATREAVAKTLGDWRSRNWIALSRGSVRLLDRAMLERIHATGDY